ncbi:hypothetical protein Anapl_00890 [Anas platyrhynchos]|uniref:Uncharacterized protein n=1 Tax=Anas platyrhynchos TaxID=8839 RepID=R0LQV7_ANAPL|nr:hypothetical protein Anapl_00890 [Anas platyrhynchos]
MSGHHQGHHIARQYPTPPSNAASRLLGRSQQSQREVQTPPCPATLALGLAGHLILAPSRRAFHTFSLAPHSCCADVGHGGPAGFGLHACSRSPHFLHKRQPQDLKAPPLLPPLFPNTALN